MPRRRTLRPEEEALWDEVARTASPMHPRRRSPLVKPEPAPVVPAVIQPDTGGARLMPFRLGEKAASVAPRLDLQTVPGERLAAAPLRMDAKTFQRMGRGRLVPEARIDLHGMTLAEAHPELIRFVLNAHMQGLRLVLVITGKGKPGPDHGPIPTRQGVLRHQVPYWLHMPPLGPVVLQVTEAHLKHGGSGAYYVYLRRLR